ncbi:hypothetical protein BD410DRAFT_85980 [Rickenella mellea]|uniref:Uncharacterized protein n=1 Tax=Rickenella mellea TaxID=50990 RepID=A0A4Y7PKZ2_9AGAM|nr:hypothetical protein BD410DRAFT_85980 [Rickenella mellea]
MGMEDRRLWRLSTRVAILATAGLPSMPHPSQARDIGGGIVQATAAGPSLGFASLSSLGTERGERGGGVKGLGKARERGRQKYWDTVSRISRIPIDRPYGSEYAWRRKSVVLWNDLHRPGGDPGRPGPTRVLMDRSGCER